MLIKKASTHTNALRPKKTITYKSILYTTYFLTQKKKKKTLKPIET